MQHGVVSPEDVHAMGKHAALCGAQLLIVPMNFAPHSVFGRGEKPLPRAGRERRWCAPCLSRWNEGAAARGGSETP